jgi:Ca2+-transporting ATPase
VTLTLAAMPDSRATSQIQHHSAASADVLLELSSSEEGLADSDARARLGVHGPNVLRRARPTSPLAVLSRQFASVVAVLLVIAGVASLIAGETLDAVAIFTVLLINTSIGFATEMRARRAMEALLRMEVPRATVRRGGRIAEIPAAHVVPGDVIRIEAGTAIAADARIIRASELRVNEASLTGESMPVMKTADAVDVNAPLPARTCMLYKGTMAVTGVGEAVVIATGMRTEFGRIGELVAGIPEERTLVEKRLDALGRRLAAVALLCGAAVIGVALVKGHELREVIEIGVALAIAAVPEGLPAVATITMAVGMHRMARRQVLVRRLPAVETLGSVTVICADKTGTLTAGEMSVRTISLSNEDIDMRRATDAIGSASLPPRLRTALSIGAIVNQSDIGSDTTGRSASGDPTDVALLRAAAAWGIDRRELLREMTVVNELPFSSASMMMGAVCEDRRGRRKTLVKGAPGSVLERCARTMEQGEDRPLTDRDREKLWLKNETLASAGLRVIALGFAECEMNSVDELRGMTFVAFAGMIDPPATGVKETISAFRSAGIRTVMLTGDQAATARAVAADIGMADGEQRVMDGREIRQGGATQLAERARHVNVFSRVSPEDKLTIVGALRESGDIVAMLGDGVNDAAALRKADVGVAMGIRGTDAAKEAADIVLRDDRFISIRAAIEEGRVVFDNIRKFVFYLFSCNLAEVLVLVAAVAAGMPAPLTPMQILWLNLVTDTFPALALAIEPMEANVMSRPPRDPQRAILSGRISLSVLVYSSLIATVSLAAFVIGYSQGDLTRASTLCFMTLALAQTFHLGNARGREHVMHPNRVLANPWALLSVGIVLGLQYAAVSFGPLANALDARQLPPSDWLLAFSLGVVPALLGQSTKWRSASRESASTTVSSQDE